MESEYLSLDRKGGGSGGGRSGGGRSGGRGGSIRNYGGGGRSRSRSPGGPTRTRSRSISRDRNTTIRRTPRVGTLRGTTRTMRRSSTRGYGRNYRHGGYSRGFWGRGYGSFYPYGFGSYWFNRYSLWLPYYYDLYAYNYYPSVWTPLYIPDTSLDYESDPYIMLDDRSYIINPDLANETDFPTTRLPSIGVDTGLLRSIGNKRREDLSVEEDERIKQVFARIDSQYKELINRLRSDGTYDRWLNRGYRIVPDLDRNRFVWIRDDSNKTIGNASDVLLNHYYKELNDDMLYEEGYLMTKMGDVFQYSIGATQNEYHPSLDEKISSAQWVGTITEKDDIERLHSALDSHTTIHHEKTFETSSLLQKNESEFLIGYHHNELPRIMYGKQGNMLYHSESNLLDLYHACEWHEESL